MAVFAYRIRASQLGNVKKAAEVKEWASCAFVLSTLRRNCRLLALLVVLVSCRACLSGVARFQLVVSLHVMVVALTFV